MIEYITDTPNAPKAIGPYAQATIFNNLVFLSGQIPIVPETGKLIDGGIEQQAVQVMKNLDAVLKRNKLAFINVMKTTIFLKDLGNFQTVNKIYGDWVGEARPARSTIQVAGLPLGAEIEIEMVAVRS